MSTGAGSHVGIEALQKRKTMLFRRASMPKALAVEQEDGEQ